MSEIIRKNTIEFKFNKGEKPAEQTILKWLSVSLGIKNEEVEAIQNTPTLLGSSVFVTFVSEELLEKFMKKYRDRQVWIHKKGYGDVRVIIKICGEHTEQQC